MEELEDSSRVATAFCKQLKDFCSHLHVSCTDLRARVVQAPIRMAADDADSVLDDFDNRISQINSDMEALKGLALGTVSYEELVGHCMELHRQNDAAIHQLESHLDSYGYVIGPDTGETLQGATKASLHVDQSGNRHNSSNLSSIIDSLRTKPKISESVGTPLLAKAAAPNSTHTYSSINQLDVPAIDPLNSSCLSIEDFGLSAAGLAALSCEDTSPDVNHFIEDCVYVDQQEEIQTPSQLKIQKMEKQLENPKEDSISLIRKSVEERQPTPTGHVNPSNLSSPINQHPEEKFDKMLISEVSADDFNSCPSWLRWQVSLQELNDFITKLNILVLTKNAANDPMLLSQDDFLSLGMGEKIQRVCLLILVRLEKLKTVSDTGSITYHVNK